MKVILTGVTGYFGPEVLRQCVANNQITSIVTLARRDLPDEFQNEKKITALKVENFGEFSDDSLEKMAGASGCIWMMGTTPYKMKGMSPEELAKINTEWPPQAARTFSTKLGLPEGQKFRFIYTSGFLVPDSEEPEKKMWFGEEIRKGRWWTEKYLFAAAKEIPLEVFIGKPGWITEGDVLHHFLGGRYTVKKSDMAAAYIDVILNGCEKRVLTNQNLRDYGAKALKKLASAE
ncbi:hypothetical protein DRE_01208 [Drechslerella stenobrocha 248]|uniref:NAD(P)-binding domain-containing protein n=1 Tax=Drechslerella stenobrocha 248 TaxID=1043628 RepID=W7HWB8_9PEZI|nr:hypothetical protein DRE_01208 [Drechslerella stenobrocha 248]